LTQKLWYLVLQTVRFVGKQKVHCSAWSSSSTSNMELREAKLPTTGKFTKGCFRLIEKVNY